MADDREGLRGNSIAPGFFEAQEHGVAPSNERGRDRSVQGSSTPHRKELVERLVESQYQVEEIQSELYSVLGGLEEALKRLPTNRSQSFNASSLHSRTRMFNHWPQFERNFSKMTTFLEGKTLVSEAPQNEGDIEAQRSKQNRRIKERHKTKVLNLSELNPSSVNNVHASHFLYDHEVDGEEEEEEDVFGADQHEVFV